MVAARARKGPDAVIRRLLALLVCLFVLAAGTLSVVPSVSAADPEPDPSASVEPGPSAEPSASADPSASAEPSASVSPTPDPTATPTPDPTVDPTATPTVSPTPSPTPPPSPTPTPKPAVPPVSTTTNPPSCRVADVLSKYRAYTQYQKTLLDWRYRVTSTYAPGDLTSVSHAGLTGTGTVRRLIVIDLAAMAKAARAGGARLAVQSAYRSYRTQVSVFNSWVHQLGYSKALLGSARPGHSEHQLGTTLDFKSYGGGTPWSYGGYDWATSKAGAWMKANAWKYGFVMSYPKGKSSKVCYGYEPWHYRYVGRPIAKAIHLSGLTPRYWLWKHGSNQ